QPPVKDDLSDSGWRSCPAARMRLHPKDCSDLTVRQPVVLGPPLLPIHSVSTGHPGGGRTRRPPGSPRRGGGVLSSVRDLDPWRARYPNGTGGLCCYSPLIRSGVHPCVPPSEGRRTSGGIQDPARGPGALGMPDGPEKGCVATPLGGSPLRPFQPPSGRVAERPARQVEVRSPLPS